MSVSPCAGQAQEQPSAKHLTLLGIDSATVAPSGTVFGSLSVTNERAGVPGSSDGSAEFGFGFGSAEDGIGIQLSAVVTSLRDAPGDSGYLSFKAARQVSDGSNPAYVGLQVDHLANWGDASGIDPTATVALTTFGLANIGGNSQMFPYVLTLGAGTDIRNANSDPGLFLGAGMGLTETLAASGAWTGETVDLGASFRLPQAHNVTLSATVNDVFDQENSQRITVSVGWFLNDVFGR